MHTRCPAPCHFINPQLLYSVKSLFHFSGMPAQQRAAFGCTCALCLPTLHPRKREKSLLSAVTERYFKIEIHNLSSSCIVDNL